MCVYKSYNEISLLLSVLSWWKMVPDAVMSA